MAQFNFIESIDGLNEDKKAEFMMLHIMKQKAFHLSLGSFSSIFIKLDKIIENAQNDLYNNIYLRLKNNDKQAIRQFLNKEVFIEASKRTIIDLCADCLYDYASSQYNKDFLDMPDSQKIIHYLNDFSSLIALEIWMKLRYDFNDFPSTKKEFTKIFACTSLAIIALAFFDMPYGYYTFLKIFLFITSIYYLLNTPKEKIIFFTAWLICAIVYNPIIPLEFRRNDWQPINICTIAYLVFWIWNNLTSNEKEFVLDEGFLYGLIIIGVYLVALFN